ncbi:MAG: gamma-glutamyltransferase, partial [Chloroflexi bacterium]|nr:gamma-glutamyltransferase [Chloroflexota bacterium]
PWMPFGTPGGDAQIQATLQFFLNLTVFGMTPQQGVEAPRFIVWSFPNSFWPHTYSPGLMQLEGRFNREVGAELDRRGHKVSWIPDIAGNGNAVCAVTREDRTGVVAAAADFRLDAYAIAR